MPRWLLNMVMILFLSSSLLACATVPKQTQAMQRGKYYFDAGYYKSAMRYLLPFAVNGHSDAEYAVGYMYYYGYGVAQDTDVAYFWVKRSADQHYEPAIKALALMKSKKK